MQIIPRSWVLPKELTGPKRVKKFPAFYGTRWFITAFTSARHLSWTRAIQSMPPHPTYSRFFLILSSHLCLGLPSGLLPSRLRTKTLYTALLSPLRATWPAHSVLLDLVIRLIYGERYISLSSSLCSLLHSSVPSSFLRPNIFLSTYPQTPSAHVPSSM